MPHFQLVNSERKVERLKACCRKKCCYRTSEKSSIRVFPNIGVGTPKSSHFNRIFHEINPSILGVSPYSWKHPYLFNFPMVISSHTNHNLPPKKMDGHVKKPNFSSPSPPKLVHQPKVLSDISFNISRTLRVFVRVAASKW